MSTTIETKTVRLESTTRIIELEDLKRLDDGYEQPMPVDDDEFNVEYSEFDEFRARIQALIGEGT